MLLTRRIVLRAALLATAAVVFFQPGVQAQSGRGTISGLVSDPTASVVSQANVEATEQDTGVVTSTRSDDHGLYSLLNLPAGTYTVEFTAPGFASLSRKGVRIGVQSAIALDVTLRVGDVSDRVTVEGDAPLLGVRNAEIGT